MDILKKSFCLFLLLFNACGGSGSKEEQQVIEILTTIAPADHINVKTEPFVSSAAFPTSIEFSSDGRLFYTEFAGQVRVASEATAQGTLVVDVGAKLVGVADVGGQDQPGQHHGLTDVALDPDFENNNLIYVFYTNADPVENRVERIRLEGGVAVERTVIFRSPKVSRVKNGGRVAFGFDGKLYVSVGDIEQEDQAQNTAVVNGKILRINSDGSIPEDNPIPGNPVYALGFRNPFGLAFHPLTGVLYVSENGHKCDDEVNRVLPLSNFGWRLDYSCGENNPKYTAPLVRINPSAGPTGIVFYQGSVFPEYSNHLFMGVFETGKVKRYLFDEFNGGLLLQEDDLFQGSLGSEQNVNDVAVSPDGNIYVASRNSILKVVRDDGV